MGALAAVLDKRGERAGPAIVTMLKTYEPGKPDTLGITASSFALSEQNTDLLQTHLMASQVLVGWAFKKVLENDKPQQRKLKNATLVFEGRIYRPNAFSSAESIAYASGENYLKAATEIVRRLRGDFSFVIAEGSRLIVGRDSTGSRPLFYGENEDFAALASELKPLWRLGIEKACSFPPGHVASLDKSSLRFKPVKTVANSRPIRITMQKAAARLQRLLRDSTRERVAGLRRVAVAFSGGLDSAIIASLVKETPVDAHLIHVSLRDKEETKHAEKVAEELRMPLHTYLLREEDVKEVTPAILRIIEDPDPLATSIGIPFYWAAEMAAKIGCKVMLSGQGADELFCGYRRYVEDYIELGAEKTREKAYSDVVRLQETGFGRDFRICDHHNVELRLPFAEFGLARFALTVPLELKIKPEDNTQRKLVLRQIARSLGLPEFVTDKPKKALQYSTGIGNALNKIAKREGANLSNYLRKVFEKSVHEEIT